MERGEGAEREMEKGGGNMGVGNRKMEVERAEEVEVEQRTEGG